jgi:hypothetical protein
MITPIHIRITDLRRLETLAEVAKQRSAGAASNARPRRPGIVRPSIKGVTAGVSSLLAAIAVVLAGR